MVLDLDETLIHYDEEEETLDFRPGVHEFIIEMAKSFEVVIFTAGMQDYADMVIDVLH